MIKKLLLISVVLSGLVLGIAFSAAAGTIYLDTMINGSLESPDQDGDAHETYIGFNYPTDMFKLNGELLFGTWEQGDNDDDFSGFEIKEGYRIYKGKNSKLYITLGGYSRKFDSEEKISGVLIGVDGELNISKHLNMEGSIGYSLNGKHEFNDHDEDANLMNLKVKLNYSLTKDLAASLGYRYYGCDLPGDSKINSKSLTLGLALNF